MKTTRNMIFVVCALVVGLWLAPCAFSFDDEPNELNWDRLGGSLSSFEHFCQYTKSHPEYRARLLAETPSNAFGRSTKLPSKLSTVWVFPNTFAERLSNGWGRETVAEQPVLSYPSGHGGGWTRAKIAVPQSGYYRVWAQYYHEQGTHASFVLRMEDPRVADIADPMQTVVQDVLSFTFDAAEMGRRDDFLPTHKDEPTGFLWEATPCVWLEKGERTLSVSGMIHEGPFAPRRIASIVLTQEPFSVPTPEKAFDPTVDSIVVQSAEPSADAKRMAALWARRPAVGSANKALLALWEEWRAAFFADLAEYRVEGIEGRRMASMVAFDPTCNLLGTPRQIRDEKERTQNFLNSFPKDSFLRKIECEEFGELNGWYLEGSADASGGQMLVASYGDGLATATYELEVPRAGTYSFWSRYLELPGYLAKYGLTVAGTDGSSNEKIFCADEEDNKKSPGFRWYEQRVELPAGRVKLTLSKEYGPGLTYRRHDCVIVTDNTNWKPEGHGEIVAPSTRDGLVVWTSDPWRGFSRFSAPKESEILTKDSKPIEVELPLGAIQSYSILVRNESDKARTIKPTTSGKLANLVSWRVQAFVLSPQFGWVPHPLLERSELTVQPGETAGVWLTFDGDRPSADGEFVIDLAGTRVCFNVARKGDLTNAPVPYVGGWNSPYELVSCWEKFKQLGLNVLNDAIVPSEEAKKYGIKLFLRLNDTDISEEHVAAVTSSFERYGYDFDDWAWSFMDEPGATMSDQWVELAKVFKERAPKVRIWCNPGEMWGAPPESDLKMTPYVDCYCPYADHFWQNGGGVEAYQQALRGESRKFALRLEYTTPCVAEKAPGAPYDMFGPESTSLQNGLDGWMFYAFLGRYEYCNSLWDEVNAYSGDQAVNLYPGVYGRTISSRCAEALRAAVDHWRRESLGRNAGSRADD